jgi:peptidoglycan/LPS O-acetylase OafA/YrhL
MGSPSGEGTALRVPPTNQRFELFESLRAIAALSVLVFHTGSASRVNISTWYGAFTSKLNVGVTLFFVISGFLLYRPHAVQMLGGPAAPPIGDYALRRAFRILPAYWAALTVLGLWPGLEGVFTAKWWVYYGLFQSYRFAWLTRGLGVAWSLSVEIAFYALLPVLGTVLLGLSCRLGFRDRMRLQLLVFAALGVGAVFFRAAIFDGQLIDLYNTLPAHCFGFLAGMSTAVVSTWFAGRENAWWATRWVAAHAGGCWALAMILFVAMSFCPAFPRPFAGIPLTTFGYTAESVVYTAIAFLVMLPAVFGVHASGFARRVLGSHFLSWIGKISYGVFLWHFPLVQALQGRLFRHLDPGAAFLSLTLLVLPVALVLGWLSWRWIEVPALRVARSLGGRGTFAAAGTGTRELRSQP